MTTIKPGTPCQCSQWFHGYVDCPCAQDLLATPRLAVRLVTISRTIAQSAPSGHTVDVDVEEELAVCEHCYVALTGLRPNDAARNGAGSAPSFGPLCRCGHRGSKRVGESALLRQCQHCGETFAFRLFDGHLVPMSPLTALALDEQRAIGRAA